MIKYGFSQIIKRIPIQDSFLMKILHFCLTIEKSAIAIGKFREKKTQQVSFKSIKLSTSAKEIQEFPVFIVIYFL
ncbi:unnamed protein product [Paramecium pentaurelia]|uniref:Uncharacterized protein n=1 Tax=Paramecium pentaurelia TaxID=43138 RepID=A0A8S1YKW4_9CILI|nr:unnamed protein product [Paramecium pentaurelia]